ncbi:glycosyltransferase family 4 protein [Methanobacterium sp.]|uniref:glycosyltransferase family 4 protein n=1 Tax=Methanobacterium sp. TaxID=2164 RepID=UPI003C75AB85
MKISYLLGEFGSTGGSIVLYNFMDNLVKRGHEVYAIMTNSSIKWEIGIWKEIIENKDSVYKRRAIPIMGSLINFYSKNENIKNLYFFYGLNKLTNGLIKNWVDSDITIATWCLTAYAAFYLSDRTVPVYHMQHYEELFFKDKVQRLIARNTYYLPLIQISNSKWLQNIILKKFNQQSQLLNPGIDLDVFKPQDDIENKYKTKNKWLIVSYFSDILIKGFEDAVQSVELARKELKKQGIEIEWKIFGLNPPSKKYTTEFEYVGKIFGHDLAKLYSKADIVLMSSWFESFPLPPLEAMSCGSLIITTQYGTEDYVFNNENGLVCLPRMPKEMAQKIIYAIKNPDKCLKMVKTALQTAESYSWKKRADTLEKLLEESLQKYSVDQFKTFDDIVNGNFKESIYKEFNLDNTAK